MPRVKRGTKRHDRRKKILALAKGYYLNKSKLYRAAKEAIEKAGVYAYRDRKVRKREFRKLWIIRIGAAARINGLSYNKLIHGLKKAGVDLNRKVLADIALQDPANFSKLADQARATVGK